MSAAALHQFSGQSLSEYAIFALVALFVIYRQFAPRPIRGSGITILLPVILTGYGFFSLAQNPPESAETYVLLGAELVVGLIAGTLRALTMRFWVDPRGIPMQRGTWLTLAIWILFIAVRIGFDLLFHGALSTSSLLIAVGGSLLVQSLITLFRGRSLFGDGPVSRGSLR